MASKTQSDLTGGSTELERGVAAGSSGDAESPPDREEIFDVLANERRRHVLAYLKQQEGGAVDFGTLVTHVAALENDIPVQQVTSTDRKSVYVGLRQTHLPKMDECGLVEYDSDRGTIELTAAAERARMYLEYVPEHDIPWCYHYLGISVLLGAMTALTWFGVAPFAGIDGMILAVLALAVFGISAVAHTVYTYRHKLGRSIDVDCDG